MSEIVAPALHASGAGENAPVVRVIDRISAFAGFIASLALAAMTSRRLLRGHFPLCLQRAHHLGHRDQHLSVRRDRLPRAGRGAARQRAYPGRASRRPARARQRQQFLELVGLGLASCSPPSLRWHCARFTFQEYVHGARDWGLLGTPQWLPQVPIAVGFILFVAALLRDIFRLHPPRAACARNGSCPCSQSLLVAALLDHAGRGRTCASPARASTGARSRSARRVSSRWFALERRRIAAATVLALLGALAVLFYFARGASQLWLGPLLGGTLLPAAGMGVRVALAMAVTGMLGLYFLLPMPQLPVIADRAWTSINTFTLTAVPSFVLMGSLLVRSGITSDLFDALVNWFGRTPGGLAHASVAASATFAAVCGSSLATAATLGSVAAPEMVKRGYSPKLTYGVVAAGATLGILIPPSIAMIIYGNVVGVAVTQLFIAGIVPGLLLSALFMVLVARLGASSFRAPCRRARAIRSREKITSAVGVLPFILLIAAVLGSLYFGIATPTEAGALGAGVALVMALQRRRLTLASLYDVLLDTVKVTAFIMLIVVARGDPELGVRFPAPAARHGAGRQRRQPRALGRHAHHRDRLPDPRLLHRVDRHDADDAVGDLPGDRRDRPRPDLVRRRAGAAGRDRAGHAAGRAWCCSCSRA